MMMVRQVDLKFFFACFSCIVTVNSQLSQDPYCINNRPPLTILPENCCTIPEFFDDTEIARCKDSRGTENLLRPVAGRKKRFATRRMELGTCYLDCVFQLSGVSSANGQVLDTNKLVRILQSETPREPDSINVITNALTQCINELNAGTLKQRSASQYNCSTIPATIMMCVHKKFFANCPVNRFTNVQQCVQLRDFLVRCPINI